MYVEEASTISGTVRWSRRATGPVLVLPDGCTDLIWWSDHLLLVGPDTAAHRVDTPAGTSFHALRFGPGLGPSVFGVPAHHLRDQQVPLEQVLSAAEVRQWEERLATDAEPTRVLEDFAQEGLRRHGSPSPVLTAVADWLGAGGSVADVAHRAGLSERQLHRRCLDGFGYGPKLLARILRLNQALELSRSGMDGARVAASAAYADQSHFARDVRALTGGTLSQLLP